MVVCRLRWKKVLLKWEYSISGRCFLLIPEKPKKHCITKYINLISFSGVWKLVLTRIPPVCENSIWIRTVKYFPKMLYLKCLTFFWIHLWSLHNIITLEYYKTLSHCDNFLLDRFYIMLLKFKKVGGRYFCVSLSNKLGEYNAFLCL